MAERTVYLVRHGCTSMNAASRGPERERGWSNVGLDDLGRKEARKLAGKLSKLGIRAIVASDLKRARQTAEIIGDWLGLSPVFNSGLRTWNTGSLEGDRKAKAEPVIRQLVRAYPDEAPKGGESFNAFCARVFGALDECLGRHTENPLAIVIHQRIERLIDAWKDEGYPRDHTVNVNVFLSKGEQPGHIEKWQINPVLLKRSGSPQISGTRRFAAARANTSTKGDVTTQTSA
jgi:broad specificity phosphatase PhoE